MKIKITLSVIFIALFASQMGNAQANFINKTDLLGNPGTKSTIPALISDFDGDYNDDILRLSSGRILYMEYQRSEEAFEAVFLGNAGGNADWMALSGDLDQDGFNEILTGGSYNGVKIYKRNSFGIYALWQLTEKDFFAQGSNLVDINNDGWLDLFVCDDDAASDIWLNDGTGMMYEQDDFINFITDPPSDNSGNYGSEWIDIDFDQDLDLYIAKCRSGVMDDTDPRRINALFINDGQNNFEQKADEFNLAIGAQSWSCNFDDLDNDGDLDAFILNHDVPYMILENQDGQFVDISESALSESVGGFGLQAVIRDFDNDGWSDILIGGGSDYMLWNKGNMQFDIIEQPFGIYEAHSFAVGDVNEDGFWDVYVGHGQNINQVGLVDDELWMNKGNDNQFVSISLLGDSSNINGIGATLKLFGEFGELTRTVRAGEGYGVCHSFKQIFGLGSAGQIDSLVIYWPSGIKDVHTDLISNQMFIAHESQCLNPRPNIEKIGSAVFCEGDSIILNAPESFEYQWSNGLTSRKITVFESGNYFVRLISESGCVNISQPVQVIVDPDETKPVVDFVQGDTLNCALDLVILGSDYTNQLEWSTGQTIPELEISSEGEYFFTAQGACSTLISDTVKIRFNSIDILVAENDSIMKGEQAFLTAFADSLHWFENENDVEPIFTGDTLVTDPLEETQSYFVRSVQRLDFGTYSIGQETQIGDSDYASNTINGQIIFDVLNEMEIQTVDVYTDTPGEREVQIFNDLDVLVFSKSFILDEGMTRLELNAILPPGEDYVITTNESVNQQVLGFASPRLERSKEATNYPYLIPGLVSLNDSNYGPEYFYYFFNWKVRVPGKYCESEAVEVLAVVEESSASQEIQEELMKVYPNPVKDKIYINLEQQELPREISVRDLQGRQLVRIDQVEEINRIEVEKWAPGIYIIELLYSKFRIIRKIVII